MKFGFHPEARLEYRHAVLFYEDRKPGLGAAFTLEIEATLAKIIDHPERHRFLDGDVRRCLAKVFPYAVLYTIEEDFILVLAVMHGSRKPGSWRDRLSTAD